MGKGSSRTSLFSGMCGAAMVTAWLCAFLVEDAAKITSTRLMILTDFSGIRSGSPGPTPMPYRVPYWTVFMVSPFDGYFLAEGFQHWIGLHPPVHLPIEI
jgi:hypothetical protein